MEKEKLLLILHYSPPIHGASKVGDIILNGKELSVSFITRFVKIKSADEIQSIGKFKLEKVYKAFGLLFEVFVKLILFKPDKIYFTASPSGFAFYRDVLISILIKTYRLLKKCDVFYHYHARGIKQFIKLSKYNFKLTEFFVKNIHLIFISESVKGEIELLKNYKDVFFLKNGVKNNLTEIEFDSLMHIRNKNKTINVLYLSNMILEKGYDTVLELAKSMKFINKGNVKFHFAGSWSSNEDEILFKKLVLENNLNDIVVYHGLVQKEVKKKLFQMANLFIFPSRYKKEVFPLSILEALSYGLPVLAFDVGAVSEIINDDIGLITNQENLMTGFKAFMNTYLTEDVSRQCRNTYLNYYTIGVFEENLVSILKNK